jgi:hypothetical protein
MPVLPMSYIYFSHKIWAKRYAQYVDTPLAAGWISSGLQAAE